ncbi:MAG: tRNA pseudouridine(38-40) synthase TruA [Candidatus Omnitrophota bacterium]
MADINPDNPINPARKNIFCEVEYDGTNYYGFQIQNKSHVIENTVQKEIERALERLFKIPVRIAFSSRTDRGVHAKAQGINFCIDTKISLVNIKRALNSFLPSDIRIRKTKAVSLDFHCRFWAISKVYRYTVFNRKEPSVFLKNYAWHLSQPLDIEAMVNAKRLLTGKKNFSLFAKEKKRYKDCLRNVYEITIKKRNSFVYIDIEADGFLRAMARSLAYFLVNVGLGKIDKSDVRPILDGSKPYSNKPALAGGLCLLKVYYR